MNASLEDDLSSILPEMITAALPDITAQRLATLSRAMCAGAPH
jgi:phage tail protein X